MSAAIYLLTICIPLGVILLIFAMKYLSAARQAQARILGEDAYRQLAQTAAAAQSETATSLSVLQTELSEIKTRLAGIEKILKAVE
ncbi:MAG TPA: hypothetical protein VII56_04775 [Rhizomicrobium sp.]